MSNEETEDQPAGYATEENSAKVLFAFDLLASLVEDAKRHPERSKES